MNLPDRFEQAGILLGSMFLVGLPVSALVGAVYGFSVPLWLVPLVWFLPGLVVGIPLAMGRLPITYHQVWVFSLSSWLLSFAGWAALGLAFPTSNHPLALLVWAGAVGVGALIAWVRPVATLRRRRQHT